MMGNWTFFSNYGHVLVCLSGNKGARLRDVAREVGITEHAVQKIVRDMQDAGFITVSKQGRCNRYELNKRRSLRHVLESHCTVGKLLKLVTRPDAATTVAKKMSDTEAVSGETVKPAMPEPTEENDKDRSPVSEPTQQLTPDASDVRKKTDKRSKPVNVRQQGTLF